MIELVGGTAAVVILLLLAALLVGQPAAIVADRATIAAQATQLAYLRSIQPTQPPRLCPGYVNCYGSQR